MDASDAAADSGASSKSQAQHEDAHPDSPPTGVAGAENAPSKKANVRKRTKTGCLTCRKRRIKCDEGRPTCNNCIKSKRMCEGYNQRVVFKEPMGAYHGMHFGHTPHTYEPTGMVSSQLAAPQSKSSTQTPLPVIAPKPPSVDFSGLPYQYGHVYQGHPGSTTSPPFDLGQGLYASPGVSPNMPLHSPEYPLPHVQGQPRKDGFFDFQDSGPSTELPAAPVRQDSDLSNMGSQPMTPPVASDVPVFPADAIGEDYYWYSDDDASMGDSGDESHVEGKQAPVNSNELGPQVVSRLDAPMDTFGTLPRTFSLLSGDNVLQTYLPSSRNSPLNDRQTASVFWYFVNVTGPSMSLYERHPFDPSPLFQGQAVPKTRQHIWTYSFPILAFSHPALLQAMLAIGALQMAKLQGVPPVASMKHYHLGLRRLFRNYQSLTRRTHPATLAATLLLGFYEVWNADHDKWSKHILGGRLIIKDIPFWQLSCVVLERKRQDRRRMEQLRYQQQFDPYGAPFMGTADTGIDGVDTALLQQITDKFVSYDDPDVDVERSSKLLTDKDIENYEHLADLYWWYCKMDVYQSILGGTRLFMDYSHWTQCPPRAPIGKRDAIYGTFDHLVLLLGRLASFMSRDLARKRKMWKMDGPAGAAPSPNAPPTFPGMFPAHGNVTAPRGFSPPREAEGDGPGSPGQGAGSEMAGWDAEAAQREWEALRAGFDLLRARFGPEFEPMGPEYTGRQDSPFGPALHYRTYSIAGVWMNYYMGLIALHRGRPEMPPVAMMAAGLSAQVTAPLANEVGRIAAGLTEDVSNVPAVSTLVGAAITESCFCLFVAGVQYRDAAQRHWTIRRLHDIARLTGWQSARQIAWGCESAWIKAASMGRGPPYERDEALEHRVPASVWLNPRRIDQRIRELEEERGHGQDGPIVLRKSEQAHYALGLLAVEQDLEQLDLQDNE